MNLSNQALSLFRCRVWIVVSTESLYTTQARQN